MEYLSYIINNPLDSFCGIINMRMSLKNQLFSNGYAILDGKSLVDLLDVDTIEFAIDPEDEELDPQATPVDNFEMVNHMLKLIHQEIAREFIEPYAISYKLLHRTIWEGNTKDADLWHTDSYEDPDMFFLLYFSDMTKYNDGALWIRGDSTEIRIVPNSGTLVAIENNDPKWAHRAEVSQARRVVACFRFLVEWKND